MNSWLELLFSVWVVMGCCGLGVAVLAAYDEWVAPWLRRRADVRWVKRQPWYCGLDEPDPAFVARLREQVVAEARKQARS